MDDQREEATKASSTEAWREVGDRLDALGKSLSAAFQQAWNDETNRQAVREVEAGLKSMSRAVADAVDNAASSSEGQQLRADAERIAQSAQETGKQVVEEAGPPILAALTSVQQGLQAAIDALQRRQGSASKERQSETGEG